MILKIYHLKKSRKVKTENLLLQKNYITSKPDQVTTWNFDRLLRTLYALKLQELTLIQRNTIFWNSDISAGKVKHENVGAEKLIASKPVQKSDFYFLSFFETLSSKVGSFNLKSQQVEHKKVLFQKT